MTEHVVDQTTPATPTEQPSTGNGRPAAPQGSVYLSDILASIRRHADDNSWCSTAEDVTMRALNDGLSFKPVRPTSDDGCSNPSCEICHPQDAVPERFTAASSVDPLITKVRLKKAIKKAYNLGYDWDEPRRLYRDLVDTYDLDEVPLPVTTYTVTFTVTDEQLKGQTADEDAMADALSAGVTAGFTVTTESTELAAPTLRT
ncbi:hypothetical protein [Actinoplanes auranticolor]|uniref:Uncharacterized protein n=1 Tax=Actinoplanes auranticolor TaxID=47988 RepID=A0A919SSC2_9ACTN|nr:hypothetical protein [Actinoplanes auranticolor]GIM77581.1 hypothetical protein Aau02nite_76550 [Actinoplanes auranticolor]